MTSKIVAMRGVVLDGTETTTHVDTVKSSVETVAIYGMDAHNATAMDSHSISKFPIYSIELFFLLLLFV